MTDVFIKFLKNKKLILLLISGIILGFILIISDKGTNTSNTAECDHSLNIEIYTEELEKKLETLVDRIQGVSNVNVMITLETGNEYVYASDDSENSQKHVVVDDDLVYVTEKLPKIKGVAIVCNGGNDEIVQTKITELTCSVLGLYSTRVYVTE